MRTHTQTHILNHYLVKLLPWEDGSWFFSMDSYTPGTPSNIPKGKYASVLGKKNMQQKPSPSAIAVSLVRKYLPSLPGAQGPLGPSEGVRVWVPCTRCSRVQVFLLLAPSLTVPAGPWLLPHGAAAAESSVSPLAATWGAMSLCSRTHIHLLHSLVLELSTQCLAYN